MSTPDKTPCRSRLISRLALGILAVAVCALPARAAEGERDEVKLLTIGNSFANDSVAFLPALAEAGGKKLTMFRANLGGCSFERHARHLAAALADPEDKSTEARPYTNNAVLGLQGLKTVSLVDALKAQPWDFVTIQQVSSQSYKPESYEPYASQIIAAIRELAPQAEILIHQTWAYREDHHFFRANDGFTPAKMYEDSRAAYHQLAANYGGLRILPVGDAMHLARQTPRWTFAPDPSFDYKNPVMDTLPDQSASLMVGWRWVTKKDTGEKKFERDSIHANTAGRYLGATTWYQVLYGTNELPTDYTPAGLAAEDAADLRLHALAAVAALKPAEPAMSE